ncbi:MAG: hypothetical protein KJ687_09930 [Proteobacteria bacterium]|nr:hypothetical protein [Pseudomonadota bacterium]
MPVFFFQSREGKEDLEWSTVTQRPRYSERIESGVFYFVAQENAQQTIWGQEWE